MEASFFVCSVCMNNYDQNERVPRVLDCGHTFCSLCVKELLKNRLKCPNDGKVFKGSLDQIPVNFIMKQMTEQFFKDKKEYCQIHQEEEKNQVCINEGCKICRFCALNNDHEDHIIQHIDLFKARIDMKKQKLKAYITEVDQSITEFNTFSKEKNDIADMIKNKFSNLIDYLRTQEQALLKALDNIFGQNDTIQTIINGTGKVNSVISKLNNIEAIKELVQTLSMSDPVLPVIRDYEEALKDLKLFKTAVESNIKRFTEIVIEKTKDLLKIDNNSDEKKESYRNEYLLNDPFENNEVRVEEMESSFEDIHTTESGWKTIFSLRAFK